MRECGLKRAPLPKPLWVRNWCHCRRDFRSWTQSAVGTCKCSYRRAVTPFHAYLISGAISRSSLLPPAALVVSLIWHLCHLHWNWLPQLSFRETERWSDSTRALCSDLVLLIEDSKFALKSCVCSVCHLVYMTLDASNSRANIETSMIKTRYALRCIHFFIANDH